MSRRSRWALSWPTTLALCVLFLCTYGVTNLLTAHRGDVPSWVLPIDRHVPFVPLLIVPYLSIDLFFLAAPFLCADDRERRRLVGRMAMAMLVASSCFLAMPLRFAFDRPAGNPLFDLFHRLDGPFNQFPSLHIAFLVLFGIHYGRHTRGVLRIALLGWFALIGVSTLLTYQHHTIDIAGGLVLGGMCLFVFPDDGTGEHVNRRVARWYAGGAIAWVAIAVLARPWGAILLWPAVAMGIVAAELWGTGAMAHRKRGGRVSGRTRLLMAPVRAGQWLSWRRCARRSQPWDEIVEGVWLGRVLRRSEAADAVARGAAAVVDLTGDFNLAGPFRALAYLNVPVPDLIAPTVSELATAAAFIAEQRAAGRTVYVCCKAGDSRSAAIVAAHLVMAGLATSADDAVAHLARRRPGLVVRPEARRSIAELQAAIAK